METGRDQSKQGGYEFMKYFSSSPVQAKWSMATGYVPVRQSALEESEYKSYAEKNPLVFQSRLIVLYSP